MHNDPKILPNEIWLDITNRLTSKEKARLRKTSRFFAELLNPIHCITEAFIKNISATDLWVDVSRITPQLKNKVYILIQDYMIANVREETWSVENWLDKHPEMIEMSLRFSRFYGHLEKGEITKDNAVRVLDYVLLITNFDFFSFENMLFFVKMIDSANSKKIRNSMMKLKNLTKDSLSASVETNKFILNVIARCLNYLFNIDCSKNNESVKKALSPLLHKMIPPFYPIIADKQINGLQIRWTFKENKDAKAAIKKLKDFGLEPKFGKVKNEFAVDLVNVEPVEILLAYNEFKKNNIDQEKQELSCAMGMQ